MPRSLLDRRLLFVSGKGGTGKTTVAAGLAMLAAEEGRRVLACEIDAKGDLALCLGLSPGRAVGFEPVVVAPRLATMAMDTEASLSEYLRLHLRIPFVRGLGPLARTFDFVADAAPGVREILTVGKLAWEVRERRYDLVVVDAPASGHVVSLLAAPSALRALVPLGPIRQQTGWVGDLLADHSVTGLVVVAVPEEMAVTEAADLVARVRRETSVDVAAVAVNRVLPELFTHAEEAVFDSLHATKPHGRLRELAGPGVDDVFSAGRLAMELRRTGAAQITALGRLLTGETLLYLPEVFDADGGAGLARYLAERLGEEL